MRKSGEPGGREKPAVVITPELLRGWPLPQPEEGADKDERGQVLVVGGSPEIPGAVILAATAALRAGAGKLRIACGESIRLLVAGAVPEARVFALPETPEGGIAPDAAPVIARCGADARAVLIGPGMVEEAVVAQLIQALPPPAGETAWILDAAALAVVARDPQRLGSLEGRVTVTPHAGEMAMMLGIEKAAVICEPAATARRAASRWGAVAALKGAETFIAAPGGELYSNRSGNVGLATSGSGDTLAGIIAGLAARGAVPLQAAVWGVFLHGSAGDRLAQRLGPLGFLARELLYELPGLMVELSQNCAGSAHLGPGDRAVRRAG